MAIDKNQNHSGLSAILSLSLPDKVPPMSPVWRPVKSTKEGVILTWEPGGSQDVVKYEVYRKGDQGQWMRLVTKVAGTDSIYTYTDQHLTNNDVQHYTVIAIDEANLESPPAPVVTGFMLPKPKSAVRMAEPVVSLEKKTIILNWTYDQPNVASYRIYRKINDGTMQLYRTVKDKQFIDSGVTTGTKYSYSVMVVFSNGALSEMSKIVSIGF
jgi:fibronectin type 3 domain-containing protein